MAATLPRDRPKVIILGAGISGLSLAWYCRLSPEHQVTLLEKGSRAGGWIHTDVTSGFHFEKGPRTFLASKTPEILELIAALGLQDQLIISENRPYKRYLWLKDKLYKFPTNPLSFIFSPLSRGFIGALFSEWKKPSIQGDESVFDFARRRFNHTVATLFFDPMVVGIFGGDSRYISVRSCFPQLKLWEETYGSITKGFWRQWREGRRATNACYLPGPAIYSLQAGIQGITDRLCEKLQGKIRYDALVQRLEKEGPIWRVFLTDGEILEADQIVSALPLPEMQRLFLPLAPDLITPLQQERSTSIVVVSLGFRDQVLPIEGFGYLTQVDAGEDILGVVFDSSIFPQHNRRAHETRLTVKLKSGPFSEAQYVEKALQGLKKHVQITRAPDAVSVKIAHDAIPQYGIGYLEKMEVFEKKLYERLSHCHLVGNYLSGVSVNQCILRSRKIADVVMGRESLV